MSQHTVMKAMLGGLLGTLGQIMLVYGVIPLITGQAQGIAALEGSPCALGLLTHILSGSVIFPLGFMALPTHDVSVPPMLRGMLWAVCLWAALESLVAPLLGAGVFSEALGGFPAALRALLGYLVYGATLGAIAGVPGCNNAGICRERSRA